ncbi:MAG: hypothetical protein ACYC69_05570 [Thermodesulfovibrionales bacterium]
MSASPRWRDSLPPAPTDFMGHKYQTKADFATHLLMLKLPQPLPNKKTGKALSADGGAQGKAYNAYRKAIKDKAIAALRKTASAHRARICRTVTWRML